MFDVRKHSRWLLCLAAIALAGTLIARAAAQGVQPNERGAAVDDATADGAVVVVRDAFDKYDALLASLTIFVLAIFVGFEVIAKVPPTLHTPLMSGSNAISGITIVGALLATGFGGHWFISFVGMIALALAAINVVGGFLVTHRMLEMFRKKR